MTRFNFRDLDAQTILLLPGGICTDLDELEDLLLEHVKLLLHRVGGVEKKVDLLLEDRAEHLPAALLEPVDPAQEISACEPAESLVFAGRKYAELFEARLNA